MANDWTVRSNAWPGGHEISRNRGLDPKGMATKGRFLLRSVEREEGIALTLFERAGEPFEQASSLVDMDAVELEIPDWINARAMPFWERLGLYSEKSNLTAEEIRALDDATFKRLRARFLLTTAVREWAESWRLDWGVVFYFATAVLIEGPRTRRPGILRAIPPIPSGVGAKSINYQEHRDRAAIKALATPVGAWKKAADEYLRIATAEMVPEDVKAVCLTAPPGFELYVGRGADEYIERQVKNAEFWCSGKANLLIPFAGLPPAQKKELYRWIRAIAAAYCERVDAALQKSGATKKRAEPAFARDLEWTVERRILNWDWEKMAKESGAKVDVVKKGVRKTLGLLELPLAPSFDPPKGRHRK